MQACRNITRKSGSNLALAFIVLGISVAASLLGITKALRVQPNEVLA